MTITERANRLQTDADLVLHEVACRLRALVRPFRLVDAGDSGERALLTPAQVSDLCLTRNSRGMVCGLRLHHGSEHYFVGGEKR